MAGAPGARTSLLGRDVELAKLRRRLDAVRDDSGVVILEGEAGIGKSQLVNATASHPASLDTASPQRHADDVLGGHG